MGKRIIAVNAGPRRGWNTDTLIDEAIRGAEAAGADTQKFDLFRLERYTGCISCFGCKREKNQGHCICRDGLTPVLDAIREGDGLIIGSPNYLSEMTASFRALYERLIFQNLTYQAERPCCNVHPVPVLLIMTSNAPERGYLELLGNYQRTLSLFVGPTQVLVSGDTLQLRDYSKTDWPWSMFDPEEKMRRHESVFPEEMKKAYAMGKSLAASTSEGD
ncbi:MAG: flavodoxin family protein [Clostridia bacterium]|nr:flavodoxin family protein [Clostridia bacterium]